MKKYKFIGEQYIMNKIYSFIGFKEGKQVLIITDVSLNGDREAQCMCLSLLKQYSLDDCGYQIRGCNRRFSF